MDLKEQIFRLEREIKVLRASHPVKIERTMDAFRRLPVALQAKEVSSMSQAVHAAEKGICGDLGPLKAMDNDLLLGMCFMAACGSHILMDMIEELITNVSGEN